MASPATAALTMAVLTLALVVNVESSGVRCYRCNTDVMRTANRNPIQCEDPFGYNEMDGEKIGQLTVQADEIHILDCVACLKNVATDEDGLQHVDRDCLVVDQIDADANIKANMGGACVYNDKYGRPGLECYCDTHLCNHGNPAHASVTTIITILSVIMATRHIHL